jgi:predicted alpha/beta hydrolase family esterase
MMNEASSKFVDNLALERLINDKVSKVRHSPLNSMFIPEEKPFHNIEKLHLDISVVSGKENGNTRWFEIPSFENASPYPENNTIYLYNYPAAVPDGNILLLHGLFDENMFNCAYLIRLLNELNFNVFYMVMPYHFQRRPAASLFSGEYFFSADIYRTQNAFKQAVFDVEASLQFIKHHNPLPVILAGFSMGGCVSFRYYLLKKQTIGTFLLNPVTDLSRIIWDNPLLVTVGRDLLNSGFDLNRCAAIFRELDPCENLDPDLEPRNIAVVHSIYDQIIEEPKFKRFIERTGIQNVHSYHAGHLNILRVPKLATDIRHFFKKQNNMDEVEP